jgi:hypothetical protein
MKCLRCLVVLVGWASVAMGAREPCVTKQGAMIGVSKAVMIQALRLKVDGTTRRCRF